MSVSLTRAALVTSMTSRHQTLGYQLNAGEIEAIVNDIEIAINNNAATALADCAADVALFPADPNVPGG